MWRIVVFLLSLFLSFPVEARHGTPYVNTRASIGTNLAGLASFFPEVPFFNFFKLGLQWTTRTAGNADTGEEALLYSSFLDANGYPQSLTTGGPCPGGPCPSHTFTELSVSVLGGVYPNGNGSWLLIYDGDDNAGSSNFEYHDDATLASHVCSGGTCTDTLNVSNAGGGIRAFLQVTNPNNNGKWVSNIRLVQASQYNALSTADKAAFNAGGIFFNPDWLAQVQQFRSFRYMDWTNANSNAEVTWASRPPVGWVFWDDNFKYYQDAPIEVMIALSNKLHANAWYVLPCLADATFATNAANLWLSTLSSDLKVILETCNEFWNHNYTTAVLNGLQNDQSTFPSCALGFPCLFDNYVYRTVRNATTWSGIWTGNNAARLTTVMGAQIGVDHGELDMLATQDGGSAGLWSGKSGTHVQGSAVAPYFAFAFLTQYGMPASWSADGDGGINKIYTQVMQGRLLPTANVTGNCGNGAGKTCGGPLHFTLTSGLSLASTPPNQTCLAFTTNSAGSGGNDLAVDSGTAFPIVGNDGVAITLANSTQYAVCFTNATSAGAVTASWYGAGIASASETANVVTALTASFNKANNFTPSLKLVGYEGGQNMTAPIVCLAPNATVCGGSSGNNTLQTMIDQFELSLQMGLVYQQMMETFKTIGLIEWHNFDDPSVWASTGLAGRSGGLAYWGFNPGTYAVGNPTPRQQFLYDYIRRTPCWWAGC